MANYLDNLRFNVLCGQILADKALQTRIAGQDSILAAAQKNNAEMLYAAILRIVGMNHGFGRYCRENGIEPTDRQRSKHWARVCPV